MEEKYRELLLQGKELSYLISAALYNQPLEWTRLSHLSEVYRLCQVHKVTALVGSVLTKYLQPEEAEIWKHAMKMAAMCMIRFDSEREEILSFLKENKIWYMPMKGLIIRELYPISYYREMCDNDILYDAMGYKVLNDFMLKRGYTIEFDSKTGHVDEYHMYPYYNFEMHKRFFMANHDLWCEYYSDMSRFLVPVSEYEYKLSHEDFYVYMILHTYKHYEEKGTGIRSLVDCFVYNQKLGEDLDWKYISKELDKLKILDFEQKIRKLSEKLFDGKEVELTKSEEDMFLFILSSGAYGTAGHYIKKQLAGKSKLQYYYRRIVPELNWFKGNVPFCYRHRWSIPFYCIYRLVDRGIRHRNAIKEEIALVRNRNE